MSFVSYAQNYEDVMLWRALKHVHNGFYIDVGANDPAVDSVTKAFYERGWKGINIEPLKSHHQDLLEARPNDINLLCAAGREHGQIDIWECDVRGWATASPDVIQKHKREGHTGVLHKVPLFPLGDICKQYVQGDIHFLKIDVEGFEKDVLKGMNFKTFRPWIIVVEATKPNSTEEIHEDWEALITSNDYALAYADGLNRFYVSKEQSPYLFDALRYPPNVFDRYKKVQQFDSEVRAQQAEAKAHQAQQESMQAEAKALHAQQEAMQAEAKALHAQQQAMQTEAKALHAQEQYIQAEAKAQQAQAALDVHLTQLHAVYASTSWRITAPLRWPIHQWLLLRQHGPKSRAKALTKQVLRKLLPAVVARPRLFSWAKHLTNTLGLTERLKPFVRSVFKMHSHPLVTSAPSSEVIRKEASFLLNASPHLTPRARQIYTDLKTAIEHHPNGSV